VVPRLLLPGSAAIFLLAGVQASGDDSGERWLSGPEQAEIHWAVVRKKFDPPLSGLLLQAIFVMQPAKNRRRFNVVGGRPLVSVWT
jgi:hypothetical protein